MFTDDQVGKYQKSLDDAMWRTKGARFNAHRRLSKKQNLVVFVTSASSIHLISLSIFQISEIFTLTNIQNSLISLSSIIVSIVILVYGLVEGGKNYGLLSEVHHRCGMAIDRVYKKIAATNNMNDLVAISEKYDDLIEKYSTNHEEIDDLYFLASHSKDFKQSHSINSLGIKIAYKYKDLFFALLSVFVPVLISFGIMSNSLVEYFKCFF